jgi:hypothetical protein
MLVTLYLLQHRLHFEFQAIFLLITRRTDIALVLFSLLFFPGVVLHETSHYVLARLLGVRTGHFSLLPQPLPDGRLRLGYVETASTDLLRDALIGITPLLAGGAFVVYQALRGFTLIFAISSAVPLVLLPPLWLLRKSLARLAGLSIARMGASMLVVECAREFVYGRRYGFKMCRRRILNPYHLFQSSQAAKREK